MKESFLTGTVYLFNYLITNNNEKLFDPSTQAKQFARYRPQSKKTAEAVFF